MVTKHEVGRLRWYVVITAAMIWIVAAAGCSTPKGQQVRSVDSTEETVKFSYDHETSDGTIRRGVMECDVEGNDLKNCRRLDVGYR